MAAAAYFDEDFLTCGVCMYEYDELSKLPKCLPCSHTVCLACLQEILEDKCQLWAIKCPFCRSVSEHDLSFIDLGGLLPNNTYALQIIKLYKQIAAPAERDELERSWCFSCGSETIESCVRYNHHTHNLTVGAIQNLKTFAKTKEGRIKKEKGDLSTAITKGKQLEKHLDLLTESLKAVQKEIEALQHENKVRLTHMSTRLAALNKTQPAEVVSQDTGSNIFSSEAQSLLNDYKTRMEGKDKDKLIKLSEVFCKESRDVASQLELCKKHKILVMIADENNYVVPGCFIWIQNGLSGWKLAGSDVINNCTHPLYKHDSVLLSYAAFSLLKRLNMFHLLSHPDSTDQKTKRAYEDKK